MNEIRFELLNNGLWRAFDYSSKMSALYESDGTYHSGDLLLPKQFVISQIATPPMVEGEGAPQYTMFDLPKDTQLALL